MSNRKALSPDYLRFSERLIAKHPEIVSGSLFGMPCLKAGKKAFAGSYDGGLVVRLLVEDAEAALNIDGTSAFDPSGRGKPMKGWVVLPVSAKRRWNKLATQAMQLAQEG